MLSGASPTLPSAFSPNWVGSRSQSVRVRHQPHSDRTADSGTLPVVSAFWSTGMTCPPDSVPVGVANRQFDLHRGPERFDHDVVESVADGPERWQQPCRSDLLTEIPCLRGGYVTPSPMPAGHDVFEQTDQNFLARPAISRIAQHDRNMTRQFQRRANLLRCVSAEGEAAGFEEVHRAKQSADRRVSTSKTAPSAPRDSSGYGNKNLSWPGLPNRRKITRGSMVIRPKSIATVAVRLSRRRADRRPSLPVR